MLCFPCTFLLLSWYCYSILKIFTNSHLSITFLLLSSFSTVCYPNFPITFLIRYNLSTFLPLFCVCYGTFILLSWKLFITVYQMSVTFTLCTHFFITTFPVISRYLPSHYFSSTFTVPSRDFPVPSR